MPLRILLAVLVALACTTSQAWATGPQFGPMSGGGGGGVGDITDVGDCTGPACFNGTSGNSLQFEGSTADASETTLTATDPTADRTITLPDLSGTVALANSIDARVYGVVCDSPANTTCGSNGTDNTTALQAAIDAAATVRGTTVVLPAGVCRFSTLTMDGIDGTTLKGQGAADSFTGTTLCTSTTNATVIDVTKPRQYIRDLSITTGGTPTAGQILLHAHTNFASLYLESVFMDNFYEAVRATRQAVNMDRVQIVAQVDAEQAVYLGSIENRITDTTITSSRTMSNALVNIDAGLERVDTVKLNAVTINMPAGKTGPALWIHRSSGVLALQWIEIANSTFESDPANTSPTILVDGGSGVLKDLKIVNSYIYGGKNAVQINGGGGIGIVNSNIFGSGEDCVLHTADAPTWLVGTEVTDCSGSASGTDSGVKLGASSRQFSMIGGRSENSGYVGNTQKYGIEVTAGADKYRFANVDCDNNGTSCATGLSPAATQISLSDATAYVDSDGSNYVTVQAPSLSANWTLTLPTTDGNANEILQTDGSGTTSWAVDDDVPEAADYSNLTGGAGIVNSPTGTIATASDEQDFLKQSASLSCAGTTPGKLIVDTTTQTLSYCPTGSTTTKYAALGNDSGQATFLSSTSCTSGVQTAADGTPSCMTAASTPEYVSRVETAGGTIQAYGVVAANGTTDDGVIEAATTVTQIIGCSQSGSSVTSTNPVEVAVAGVARCSTDASVVSGSLVKLGATGQFALGTTAEKTWGRALTDSTGASGSAYILLFDGAEGYIDHAIDVWPSIPDLTSNTVNMINESPTVDISSNGTLRGLNFAPTSTITGTSAVRGVLYSPTVTLNGGGDLSSFYIVASGGTITSAPTTAAFGPVPVLVAHQMTYTSSTNGKSPMYQGWGLFENPTISSSGTSGTATTDSHTAADDNPTFNQTGNGGTLSITTAYGFRSRGTLTAGTGGTGTIVTRKGFAADDITTSGAGTKSITTNIGVDIAALSNGTTNIGLRNADTTVYTPPTNVTVGAAFTLTATATLQKLDASAAHTSDTTTAINDGQADGQIFIIVNADSADIITIKNAANTDLGADCALNPGGVLQVIWMATASNWSQISCSAN